MQCKCGFSFVESQSSQLKQNCSSYAVISDGSYKKFIRREMKVLDAKPGSEEWYAAIADSAELVGSLKKCPACERLRFLDPDTMEVSYYREDNGKA